jgi:two-component system, OmpR family, phosphate regulon sensor histidine kinase PhoR
MRPNQLIFIGSLASSLFSLFVIGVNQLFSSHSNYSILFFLPIGIFAISYAVFSFLIKRYLTENLKILYRSIRKGKFTSENDIVIQLNKDVIEEATHATKDWSDLQSKELTNLKEQEAFRREFLGNLAHELKTPMFSIQGYILTLLEGGLEDPKVNRKFLERASLATTRMTNILEDLDKITALEAKHLNLDFSTFDIVSLCREVLEVTESVKSNKNIHPKFAQNYESIIVNADRSKIGQVLTNLINNSIFYGNQDGTTLIRIFEMGNLVTIDVADDGPGIEDEHIPRLFERFYRVEKSRARNEGGSGLGLAIVKHIIESHDQRISVRSTVGIGSTFTFSLDKV